MSNSKDNNKTSKYSFNKSISSTIDDLEMSSSISKDIDSEMESSTFNSDLKGEFSSNIDLEIVPKINEEPKSKFGFSKKKSNIFSEEKLTTKSKIFALLGLILGLGIIIDGIMSFANVSDRVIDNVLLGEAGSWSIIIILIGLIIILLDVFYIFYYKKSLKNSNIKSAQIRNTFDTIDKIKSIDSDYYQKEANDSLFKNFLKLDEEESSENNLKTSTFNIEEIYVNHGVRDLDRLDSVEDGKFADLEDIDVFDSNNIDFFNDENSIFEIEKENLSNYNQIDDLEIVPEIEEPKSDKYHDLSSFLNEEDNDLDKSEFRKYVDIDSVFKELKPKSSQKKDLTTKKARIIEGTNFDIV